MLPGIEKGQVTGIFQFRVNKPSFEELASPAKRTDPTQAFSRQDLSQMSLIVTSFN